MHNHDPMIYKQCRNKIAFNWIDKNSIFLYTIVNPNIINIIQFLLQYEFSNNTNITIQANDYNCGLIINTITNYNYNFILLLLNFNVNYLEINNNILINNKYFDIINNIKIFRHFNTFHQCDDNIKNKVHSFILENANYDNIICIGGEMYIFSKILNYKNIYCYSDYNSIVEDTIFNLNTNINIELVDYDKLILPTLNNIDCIITNTSKNGLGKKLSNTINNSKIENLIIISCNQKSFYRDLIILSN